MNKGLVNIENLTAPKAKEILGNFSYPLAVDKKGRLMVTGKVIHIFINFKSVGNQTELKRAMRAKWINIAKVLFIPFWYIYGNIKAIEEQNKLFDAVFNALSNTSKKEAQESKTDAASQLEKLAELVEKGILSKEEFEQKKAKLLEQI